MAKNYKTLWREGDEDNLVLAIGFFLIAIAGVYLISMDYKPIINTIVAILGALGGCIHSNLYLDSCPQVQVDGGCEEGI